jgi:ATP-dependent Clp protease ATP-binding subunit ClpX
MPTPPTAVAILQFGKLIHDEDRRHVTDRNAAAIRQSEEQLIDCLQHDRSPALKRIFGFNVGSPVDPLVLGVVAYVAYANLCTTRLGIAVSEVVKAVAGEEPAMVLEARQAVSKLLIGRQLALGSGNALELGRPILDFMAGGKHRPPLVFTEWSLQAAQYRAEVAKNRKEKVSIEKLPSAKELAARIAADVVGLDVQVKTLSCRLALHMRRAVMIREGRDPGSPNEALLFIGPSGCGKTWVAETAGRICNLPFAAVDSTSLTAEGYIGLGCDDALKQVVISAKNDLDLVRSSMLFFDEFDKRRSTDWGHGGRDVAGASVQQAMLRMLEGTEYQVGGRKGGYDWAPTVVNTKGMFFTLAGAFVGLEEMLGRHGAHGIGFGGRRDCSASQARTYDALQEFGLIPELLNRLSAVIFFPEPSLEQLIEIATRSVIPSTNRLLEAFGAGIEVSGDGLRLMAGCALESRTYARGVKSVVTAMVEDLVFEGRKGTVQLGVEDVRRAVEMAGLGAVAASGSCPV